MSTVKSQHILEIVDLLSTIREEYRNLYCSPSKIGTQFTLRVPYMTLQFKRGSRVKLYTSSKIMLSLDGYGFTGLVTNNFLSVHSNNNDISISSDKFNDSASSFTYPSTEEELEYKLFQLSTTQISNGKLDNIRLGYDLVKAKSSYDMITLYSTEDYNDYGQYIPYLECILESVMAGALHDN